MPAPTPRVILFSDLDGCLLNKHDYDFSAAVPQLRRAGALRIPIVLASSKTETEMLGLAEELGIETAPLICENGGTVLLRGWSNSGHPTDTSERIVLGEHRDRILAILAELQQSYQFRSFRDLGVEGVAESTNLPPERAAAALQRSSTEPLLWDDAPQRISTFRERIEEHNLTLTRGGRFWHVAGKTSKGLGMQRVLQWFQNRADLTWSADSPILSIAVGDSPIDQSMLDLADYPIGIPAPDGLVHVTISGDNGRVAEVAGASGWAETVRQVLDEIFP